MKLNLKNITIILVLMFVLTLNSAFAGDRYILRISNPKIVKVPIAVPLLMTVTGGGNEAEVSAEISKMVSDLLEFTGSFDITDRAAYLDEPAKTGIEKNRVNFKNWIDIGTEFLVTGAVHIENNYAYIEFHLYDTVRAKELVYIKYKERRKNILKIAKHFATRIVRKITGNKGFFKSKIAFISNGTGHKEIYLCNFDGSAPVQLTQEKTIVLSPSWSHDCKKIAYTSYRRGKPEIYVKNLAYKTVKRIYSKGVSNITPVWIPGDNGIAFSLSFNDGQSIYQLTKNRKQLKRLTRKWSKWGIDVSPTFSPDGKKMAFVSSRSGTPQIFLKNLENNSIERLTFSGRYNTSPSWSPDGKSILYSGAIDGHFDIFVINLDGSDPVRLTVNSGDNEDPSWAPDGSMIAFSSNRDGRTGIWVMTRSGTDQRRLFKLKGEQTSPRWSPNITR